jgi:hypothetical protein
MNWAEYKAKALERITKRYIDAGGKSMVMLKAATIGAPQDAGAPKVGDPYEITCYATRATVDLEGDVVLPDGGDVTSYFNKNRTLFVDHEYDVMKAVGKCRWLKMTPSGWLCKSALIQNRENKYRNQVESLAESGNIGHSIGMEVLDYSGPTVDERKVWPTATGIIRAWRLLEISYTAIPMNGDCQSDSPSVDKSAARRVVIF